MLNLKKSTGVVLNLIKDQGIAGQMSGVRFVADYSGSMDNMYRSRRAYGGEVEVSAMQKAVQRVLPVAMAFEKQKQLTMSLFDTKHIPIAEKLGEDNVDGYIERATKGRSMGGTSFAPFINAIAKEYMDTVGYTKGPKTITVEERVKPTSWWGLILWFFFGYTQLKLVEKTTFIPQPISGEPADEPLLVIVYTDGENDDQAAAIKALENCAYLPIFFQFIGLSDSGCSFRNLKELDEIETRYIDNANFFEFSLAELNTISDEEIYKRILNEYGLRYIPKAKSDRYKLIK